MTNSNLVRAYLRKLQDSLCQALEKEEPTAVFREDNWTRDDIGNGCTRVLQNGVVFESAGVNFSFVSGDHLPAAATQRRPELVGAAFEAMGISSVIHPRNPFVPTTHLNVRYFQATQSNGKTIWWFGGGYDLTPYYPFEEDCVHWHQTAKNSCDHVDKTLYPRFKKNADDYFYLKHRNECRGIGGLFFDDFNELPFDQSFLLMQQVGNSFIDAYMPIVSQRKSHPFTQTQRDFQRYRRGRYVEFNLLYDRGTLFGLQFGGRIESILMSLPPSVAWQYDFHPEKDSSEEKLIADFLKPREWV